MLERGCNKMGIQTAVLFLYSSSENIIPVLLSFTLGKHQHQKSTEISKMKN